MTILAKKFDGAGAAPVATSSPAMALPTGSVWMATGLYSYGGQVFDCTEEGLYRFFNPTTGATTSRLALKNFTGGANLYKVLEGVCWNHVHGAQDTGTSWQAMSNAGMARKWRAQCGTIVGLMVWALNQFGFTARSRNPTTLEPLNGYDDGHVVLETQHGSDWRMWDLTNGVWYRNASGKHLSTTEFVQAVTAGGALPEAVLLCPFRQNNSDTTGAIDLAVYGDMKTLTPAEREAWVRRIFQSVPA